MKNSVIFIFVLMSVFSYGQSNLYVGSEMEYRYSRHELAKPISVINNSGMDITISSPDLNIGEWLNGDSYCVPSEESVFVPNRWTRTVILKSFFKKGFAVDYEIRSEPARIDQSLAEQRREIQGESSAWSLASSNIALNITIEGQAPFLHIVKYGEVVEITDLGMFKPQIEVINKLPFDLEFFLEEELIFIEANHDDESGNKKKFLLSQDVQAGRVYLQRAEGILEDGTKFAFPSLRATVLKDENGNLSMTISLSNLSNGNVVQSYQHQDTTSVFVCVNNQTGNKIRVLYPKSMTDLSSLTYHNSFVRVNDGGRESIILPAKGVYPVYVIYTNHRGRVLISNLEFEVNPNDEYAKYVIQLSGRNDVEAIPQNIPHKSVWQKLFESSKARDICH